MILLITGPTWLEKARTFDDRVNHAASPTARLYLRNQLKSELLTVFCPGRTSDELGRGQKRSWLKW